MWQFLHDLFISEKVIVSVWLILIWEEIVIISVWHIYFRESENFCTTYLFESESDSFCMTWFISEEKW